MLNSSFRVSQLRTYDVVLNVGILDNLRAQFGTGKEALSRSIAEIVRALLRTMQLVQYLCGDRQLQ